MKINITTLVLSAVILLLVIFQLQQCTKHRKEKQTDLALINSIGDTLKTYINANKESVATISALKTNSTNDFLKLISKDSEIIRLQQIVYQYKGKLEEGSSVTNALIETVAELKNKKPPTITKYDTVTKDSVVYVYPTYQDSMSNKWVTVGSTMNRDSSSYRLKVNNEFSAIIGIEKRKPFVDLILYNPYSTTKQLRTYQVSLPPPKKWAIGPNVSYGVGPKFKPQIYIGVGLIYGLIRF